MIELIGLSLMTKQMILLGVGVFIVLLLIGFCVTLFLKMRVVKDEHSVESLPTLIDLGLEENEDLQTSASSPEEDQSAFFDTEEDEDEILQGKFLG